MDKASGTSLERTGYLAFTIALLREGRYAGDQTPGSIEPEQGTYQTGTGIFESAHDLGEGYGSAHDHGGASGRAGLDI